MSAFPAELLSAEVKQALGTALRNADAPIDPGVAWSPTLAEAVGVIGRDFTFNDLTMALNGEAILRHGSLADNAYFSVIMQFRAWCWRLCAKFKGFDPVTCAMKEAEASYWALKMRNVACHKNEREGLH